MVSAYVAGIFTMQHRLDGAVDAETHIDYLYNPHNLLTACSILATHGIGSMDRTAVYRDITTLVQLRPRDAAWDDCRRKLRDLVQGDGGDFFNEQRIWPWPWSRLSLTAARRSPSQKRQHQIRDTCS